MEENQEMKKYIRVVGILGIIQVVLLTLVWLYFYRLGQGYAAQNIVEAPSLASDISDAEYNGIEKKQICVRGGCSGQLCIDEEQSAETMTTCEYREEYVCYDQAVCGVQGDGECGFTETPELKACLQKRVIAPVKKINAEVFAKPEPM